MVSAAQRSNPLEWLPTMFEQMLPSGRHFPSRLAVGLGGLVVLGGFWLVCAVLAGFLALAGFSAIALADHDARHDGRENGIAEAFGDGHGEGWVDPFPAEALLDRAPGQGACPELLDHRIDDLRVRRIDLCAFAGKVLLVVNTASFCGYTYQYKALEALYETYRDDGLVVMGFPANDFGRQEPGSNAQIGAFCEKNYGVRFPMFTKVVVRGAGKIPLFRQLTGGGGDGVAAREIAWNFEKFLVDRRGRLVKRFRTRVEPGSGEIVGAVESALQVN